MLSPERYAARGQGGIRSDQRTELHPKEQRLSHCACLRAYRCIWLIAFSTAAINTTAIRYRQKAVSRPLKELSVGFANSETPKAPAVGRRVDIDIAKGIGISLVVFGHLGDGLGYASIYLFHMPLFFMIGGLLSSEDPAARLQRRIVSISLPYTVFLIFLWVVPTLAAWASGTVTRAKTFEDLARALVGGQALYGSAGVFWFVSAYALVLAFAAIVLTQRSRIAQVLLTFGAVGGALILGYALPELFLPLAANVVPVAFAFFLLGRMLHEHDFARCRPLNLALVVSGAIAIVAAEMGLIAPLDLKYADYGTPVLSLAAAGTAALGLMVISAALKDSVLSSPLAFAGTASLFVMYTHLALSSPLEVYTNLNGWWVATVTMVISVALYRITRLNRVLSLLLLGVLPKRLVHRINEAPLYEEQIIRRS